MSHNLCTGGEADLRQFISDVFDQAVSDHRAGTKTRRTGKWLTDEWANEYRRGHWKLASMVYNSTRWSLELSERDRKAAP